MGTLKLIQGAFNGKVGELYGTRQYRKYFVKAVPFSHTPHNALQNKAFSAFGCLQRMSSQFVKGFWQYLGLSDRDMNKINAVAHFLKPVISEKDFSVWKIKDVIKGGNELTINEFSFSEERQSFVIDYSTNIDTNDKSDIRICYAFIADDGKGFGGGSFYGQSGTMFLPTTWQNDVNLSLVFFLSFLENHKRTLCACDVEEIKKTVFSNGGWFPIAMQNGEWFFQSGGIIGENVENFSFADDGLIL